MKLLRSEFLYFFLILLIASCSKKQLTHSAQTQKSWIKASQEIESSHSAITYNEPEANLSTSREESLSEMYIYSDREAGKVGPIIVKPGKHENKKPNIVQVIKEIKKAKADKENNPTAIDAFVLSLLGLLLPPLISLFVLGPAGLLVVVNLLGFILLMLGFGKGIKALKELKQYQEQKGKGFAITAIVFGVLGILAIITALLLIGGVL